MTIDGPGGSGKGTLSQWLSSKLNWHFLDSGALYRALAHYARVSAVSMDDEAKLYSLALELPIVFIPDPVTKLSRVLLADEDVSQKIRTVDCGSDASKIGSFTLVREALLARQRNFIKLPGLVADGRDMGTVVFPEAQLKLFLTATAEERAKRRFKQLQEQGKDVTLDRILSELRMRDERDVKRAVAPLKAADDAVIIDTTGHSIEDVKSRIWQAYRAVFETE